MRNSKRQRQRCKQRRQRGNPTQAWRREILPRDRYIARTKLYNLRRHKHHMCNNIVRYTFTKAEQIIVSKGLSLIPTSRLTRCTEAIKYWAQRAEALSFNEAMYQPDISPTGSPAIIQYDLSKKFEHKIEPKTSRSTENEKEPNIGYFLHYSHRN